MNRELLIENGNYRGGKEEVCVKNRLGFITSLDFFQKLREGETLECNRLSQMEIERSTGIPHIDRILW